MPIRSFYSIISTVIPAISFVKPAVRSYVDPATDTSIKELYNEKTALMKRMKQFMDPNNILNPGRVIT